MSVVRLTLMLWGTFYLVLGSVRTSGDGDLYWQRWLGDLILRTHHLPATLGNETFTAAGAPWVPQEWLFSLAVALAIGSGLFLLLSIAVSAIPLGILTTIYVRARAIACPEAVGVALLFCGIAMAESFGIRAQVLGWGALALFLFFLERRDRWYYAAFPATILWANLHASVMIAPVIVLARVVAAVADRGVRGLRTADLAMLPLTVLATCCTPLGVRVPLLAIELVGSPIRHYIMEWQPAGFGNASFLAGALPLALFIVLGGKATLWQDKSRFFPSLLLFVAMLFASRNIPLFAILASPLAAKGLDIRFSAALTRAGRRVANMERPAFVAICIAVLLSVLLVITQQRYGPPRLPVAAVASVAKDRREHRLFCEDFSWCSIALLYPTLHVFLDGRADAYPVPIWTQYVATIRARRNWSRPLHVYDVDVALVARDSRLYKALRKTPGWRATYDDGQFAIYRRE